MFFTRRLIVVFVMILCFFNVLCNINVLRSAIGVALSSVSLSVVCDKVYCS